MLVRTEEFRAQACELYDRYVFLAVTQAVHGFCNHDLGRFYFDIIKDRLYTLPATSHARRSAQTAIYHIVRTVLVALGPIISFTTDEAWQVLCDDPNESTMLHALEPLPPIADAAELTERWQIIRQWRSRFSKEVEQARANRNLECPDVELHAELAVPDPDYEHLAALRPADLATVLIVSSVALARATDTGTIKVSQAQLEKCARCWRRDNGIGTGEHPEICLRCEQALAGKSDDLRQA